MLDGDRGDTSADDALDDLIAPSATQDPLTPTNEVIDQDASSWVLRPKPEVGPVRLEVKLEDPRFPFGKRGEKPCWIYGISKDIAEAYGLDTIPGVTATKYNFVRCTIDCVPVIYKRLGQQCPPLPLEYELGKPFGIPSSFTT